MIKSSCTVILTVSEYLKMFIQKNCKLNKPVYLLRNGTIPEYFTEEKFESKEIDLIYAGMLTRYRRIEDIMKFLHLLFKHGKYKVVFLSRGLERYKALKIDLFLKKYSLEDKVIFSSMVDYSSMIEYLEKSKVGLIALPDDTPFAGAIGVKVYDYLTAGIPIVCIGAPDKHPELNETIKECGVISNDLNSLVHYTLELINNNIEYNFLKKKYKKMREKMNFKKEIYLLIKNLF